MEFKTALFYVFSAILVVAATRVITDRNPVHAALYLVLSFFSAAAIWMLLKAEFLAIVLVLVYVGAVMVLFRGFLSLDSRVPEPVATIGNTRELGRLIYTQYVYGFEIAAVILLVAIVAAIAITLRHRKETKYQDPATQLAVHKADRLKIVKMAPEAKQ